MTLASDDSGAAKQLLSQEAEEYPRTGKLLDRDELKLIYGHRRWIKPDKAQARLIVASMRNEEQLGLKLRHHDLGWYWLRKLTRSELADLVTDLAGDPNPTVRWSVANLLGLALSGASFSVLEKMIDDPEGAIAGEAAQAIARYRTLQSIPILRRTASNAKLSWEPRHQSLKALAGYKRAGDTAFLRKFVSDPRPDIRGSMAAILSMFSSPDDVRHVRELARDKSPHVRCQSIRRLGKYRQPEDHQWLKKMIQKKGCVTRSAVVIALAEYVDESDLPLFRRLTEDPEFGVRSAAVEAIGRFQRSEDEPLLRKLALSGSHNAIDSLLSLPPESVIRTFRDFLKHRSATLRCRLASGLGDWHHPESPRILHRLLRDRDTMVMASAVSSLGALGDSSDLPLLRKTIIDKAAPVRLEAVWAIGQFRKTDDIDLLKARLFDEAAEVRTLAARVLAGVMRRSELQKWFNANSASLSFEALKEIDYRLYSPRWFRDAEKRAKDDLSMMDIGVCRHGL